MMTIVGIAGSADGFLPHAGPALHKPAARANRFALDPYLAIEQVFGDFQSVYLDKINLAGSKPWK
jgi:hypothetical protein